MLVLLLETNSFALQRALERKGHHVEVAQDAADADARARAGEFGVIVLQRELLNGGGLDLLKKWRSSGIKAHVMVLADDATLQDKLDALSVGADDFVVKPYEPDELTARLGNVSGRADTPVQEIMTAYDLHIDPALRLVKRGGRTVNLTPREFDLLLFLAHHRGKPVSRSMIWEHFHGEGAPSRSNVVDVYIRYLRKKLDAGDEPALILTCWGKGYMLRGPAEEPA